MMPALAIGLAASVPVGLVWVWKKLNSPFEITASTDLSDPYWAYPFDRFIDYSVVAVNTRARVVSDAIAGEGWYGGGHWIPVPQTNGRFSPEVRSPEGIPPLLFICSKAEQSAFLKHAALIFPELLTSQDFVVDIDYCSLGEQLMLLSLNEYHGFKLRFRGTWLLESYYAPQNTIGNTYLLKMPPETVSEQGVRPAKHFLNFLNELEKSAEGESDSSSEPKVGKGLQTFSSVGEVSNVTKVGAVVAGSLAAVAAIYLISPSLCEIYLEKNPSAKASRLMELIANCPSFITTHTKSYGVLHTDRGPRLISRRVLFTLLRKFKHYKIAGSETLFDLKWRGGLEEGAFISRNLSGGGVIVFDKLSADKCEATLIVDGEKLSVVLVD